MATASDPAARAGCALAAALALTLACAAIRAQDPKAPPPAPAPAPAPEAASPADAPPPGGADLIERLRARCPDLAQVALDQEALVEALLGAEGDWSEDAEAGRRRVLAGDLLEAVGQEARARTLWVEVAGRSRSLEVACEGRYRLGLHYLLRERYSDAWKYWQVLPQVAPEGPFTKRAERYATFLSLAADVKAAADSGGAPAAAFPELPELRGRLGDLGEKSLADFRGRWLVLEFWASAGRGARAASASLSQAIAGARQRGWDGAVIGINLDRDRAAYEKALAEWTGPRRDGGGSEQAPLRDWPQHHDGLGFESPWARALGIPRQPLQLLIRPDGRLIFISTSTQGLDKALEAIKG
jgi:hypothetical protein